MYRIVMDSSDRFLAVGLANEEGLIDGICYEAWQRQSEAMIPELDKLCVRHGVSRSDIEAIMVTKGPGSYTGVRIALTIAKVMALALHCPLYLVSSLEVLKDPTELTICLMNARSGRSYVGVYQGSQTIIEDTIWTNEEVRRYLSENPHMVVAGMVEYLGMVSQKPTILETMALMFKDHEPILDPLLAKPVYLKD